MNIWIAASDGRLDIVEQLLSNDKSLSVNSKDANGYTPMHAAAAYGHNEMLRKFVKQHGGDICIRDSDGDTPLHHCEDPVTAKLIVELGGDLSLRNSSGQTPLELAEENGEFPELLNFYRTALGISEQSATQPQVRYTMSELPDGPDSATRRAEIEHLVQEGNDQALEDYVRGIVLNQLHAQQEPEVSNDEAPDLKRRNV